MSRGDARLYRGSSTTRHALTVERPENRPRPTGPGIQRIEVEGLFGRYSYRIPPQGSLEDRRLLILYGDNGSGKTTLLEFIYHLLSPAPQRGHRSELANIPFQNFRMWFTDNSVLSAERPTADVGSFTVSYHCGEDRLFEISFEVDDDGRIPPASSEEKLERYQQYANALRELSFFPYYLADDRNIHSDRIEDDEDIPPWERRHRELQDIRYSKKLRRFRRDHDPELDDALESTSALLSYQVIRGSSTGSAGANSIYLDVAKRIARHGDVPIEASLEKDLRESLGRRIEVLGERTSLHERYNLVPSFPAGELREVVERTPESDLPLLEEILSPYLDGLRARLDALQDVANLIEIFVSSVNDFLRDKEIDYTPGDGLTIETVDGTRIAPARLSSGERQLLLLLSSVIRARNDTRLFIIDEPELSLNVKWQRRLFDTLLECSSGTDMQFVVATHSVEMVTGYSESVVRLYPDQ